MDDYFYIDNCSDNPDYTIPLIGYLLNCRRCGKKIAVTISLNGTNHNMSVLATCGECVLPIDPVFETAHPEASEKIKKWINGS